MNSSRKNGSSTTATSTNAFRFGAGIGRLTTVEVELDDTAQRLTLPAHVTGERAEFLCLPLGENPTAYDSYLVRARDGEPA